MYTDYMVVSGNSPEALSREVKQYLSMGWQPLGGIEEGVIGPNRIFLQAMGKTE